ncbi:hypothetical protein QYF36_021627 [Acer negundo]|nr:hypothetical protein QYF36_021627 [Acer negundo]
MTRSEKGEPSAGKRPRPGRTAAGKVANAGAAAEKKIRNCIRRKRSGKHLEEARRRMKSDQGQVGRRQQGHLDVRHHRRCSQRKIPNWIELELQKKEERRSGEEEAASEKRRSYAGNGRTAPTSSLGRGTSPPTAAAAAGCRRRQERKLIRALIPYRI